jgi:TPR repeat protein
LVTFIGGTISLSFQRKEIKLRTVLKEQAEADKRFLGLKAKAEQGDDLAQHQLGVGYLYGQGVPQDLKESVRWLRKAADQNNPYAQSMLGHAYANGHGVAINILEAYAWHHLAAMTYTNMGSPRDALSMGMSATQIIDSQKRAGELRAQIKLRLTTQAESGDAAAQNRLANFYYLGQGAAHNGAEAVKWYRRAAEQGKVADIEAQNNLAWILAVSKDVTVRDGKEAVKWATQACAATGNIDWQKLDTLAAAFAEAGDFPNAVKFQKMALDHLTLSQVVSRTAMLDRLKLYQQGLPYRE